MVNHGRVELLAHPLSQKYLQMKWNSYGKYFHMANLLLYSIYLICVTIFSAQMMQKITTSYEELEDKSGFIGVDKISPTTSMYISSIIILIYTIFSFIKELIQLKQTKCQNILEISNLISWMLFVFSFMMILPVFSLTGREHTVNNVHYTAASITVFLSWFRLLLYLQRFDQVCCIFLSFKSIFYYKIKFFKYQNFLLRHLTTTEDITLNFVGNHIILDTIFIICIIQRHDMFMLSQKSLKDFVSKIQTN